MNPMLVLIHVAAQLAGAAIALLVVAVTYPRISALASSDDATTDARQLRAKVG